MSTTLIRSLYNIPKGARGGIVTIGNFDGVHLGHQALIANMRAKAQEQGLPTIVMTFEPHPFEYFNTPHSNIPRLTRLREKFVALAKEQVDYVLILPFNQALAELSASDFVSRILYEKLATHHLLIGDDFRFGHKRQGDFALLKQLDEQYKFTVEAMPTILMQGERISSTRVRQALLAGDQALARALLGRPYSMLGRVSGGDQLGRTLGFPTANIFLHRHLTPVLGIYTVYMHGIGDQPLPGVANVGTRPTVDGTRCLLEVHLLDFNQDIYGRYVEVEFCEKLRDEVRYPNLNLLKDQIAKDVEIARHYFQTQGDV